MNKERVLKEAQEIASHFSFWMVSGNISHLYGHVLEVSDTKYELEIKFTEDFPLSRPKLKFYDAIKNLLKQVKLDSLEQWTEENKVVDILFELKRKIEEALGMQIGDEKPIEPFSEVKSELTDESLRDEDEGYITPDLDAYPPEFDVSEYINDHSENTSQQIQSKSEEGSSNKNAKPQKEIPSEANGYLPTEILDVDHSSVPLHTEIGLIQQEYAFDQAGTSIGNITVYLTITLTKTFMIEIDLNQYPEKPRFKLPDEVRALIGEPENTLSTLKNWDPKKTPHVIDILHELESKLLFIKDIEIESKKIQGEYQCETIPSDLMKLRIHLVTYGFNEYLVDIDLSPYPKRPRFILSPELEEIIKKKIEDLDAYKGWKENESESVELLREISWLVDKNSRINFEMELLKEHYKNINYVPETQTLNVDMKGKMKSQDLTFQFQLTLPNEYPMKVPEVKVVNEFELETHEKIKKDLQASFESFFDDWTPFKYLVDLFNAISKKIFEVSVVSCVICHKIDCPTCSKKIAGPDQESCHVECPYCERPYHEHCWAQTIRSFGKCGFCLKTPPLNMMPQ